MEPNNLSGPSSNASLRADQQLSAGEDNQQSSKSVLARTFMSILNQIIDKAKENSGG